MKKYILILIFALPIALAAQMTYVPDDKFEQALINLGLDSGPLNDSIPTKNIDTVTVLKVNSKHISDLTGIEDFKALTSLYCSNNRLTSLDVSKNTALTSLDCSDNGLTSLDVSNNSALGVLLCQMNALTSLDISKNTFLGVLFCYDNAITILDVSKNTALTWLICDENYLTSLDVSKNIALDSLYCSNNRLTSLDVSKNIALTVLHCFNHPDLYCIQVADSAEAANNSDWRKDEHAVWSEDCSLVSVEETSYIENICISPNPATDYIEVIGVEGRNEVKIYDVMGVQVASTGMSFLRKQVSSEQRSSSHGSFNEIPNQVGNDR